MENLYLEITSFLIYIYVVENLKFKKLILNIKEKFYLFILIDSIFIFHILFIGDFLFIEKYIFFYPYIIIIALTDSKNMFVYDSDIISGIIVIGGNLIIRDINYLLYGVSIDFFIKERVATTIFVILFTGIIYLLTKSIGDGDIIYFIFLSFSGGIYNFMVIFIFSYISAFIYSIPILLMGEKRDKFIAFTPFISIGFVIAELLKV